MTKISQLPSDTAPSLTDSVPTLDIETTTTKRVLLSDIKVLIAPQRTRTAQFQIGADNGTTGAIYPTQQEANEVRFNGTPTGYARLNLMVPQDYVAGTTATISLGLYADNANAQLYNYYISSRPLSGGGVFTSWNVQNNQLTASASTSTTPSILNVYTIPSASLAAGNNITVAVKPNSAVTGFIYLVAAYLTYTASI